jgi:hypothetical protein
MDYTTPYTQEECVLNMKELIDKYANVKEIPYAEYKAYLKEKGIPDARGKNCVTNAGKTIGHKTGNIDSTETNDNLNPETIGNGADGADGAGGAGGAGGDGAGGVPPAGAGGAEGFTETGGYQIKKDDTITSKVAGAKEAYRVQKGVDEYFVFKGSLNAMTGGQKKSKSQKRGGKKQRQTKRKMGGRRRSNRRR